MNIKPKIQKECKICKKTMFLQPSIAKTKTLCSRDCNIADIKSRKNRLGKKHTDQTKQNISNTKKGTVSWNKGLKGYLAGEKHLKYKDGKSKTKTYRTNINKLWIEKNRLKKNFLTMKRRSQLLKLTGTHTFEEWKKLCDRYNYMCLCCKRVEPEITLSQDHIIPVSKGGSDNIENIQPLCRSCNSRKYNKQIDYISTYQILTK